MKEQCFDEGIMQAFLDGELAPGLLENVARHVALCDSCALLLQDAEEESAFAFSLLDEELNSLVPTERIRANVYQAISQIEEPKRSLWHRFLGFASSLANPTVAAFASLLIVFGVFAAIWSFKSQNINTPTAEVVATSNKPENNPVTNVNYAPVTAPEGNDSEENKKPAAQNQPRYIKTVYRPETKVENQRPNIKDQKPKTNPANVESIDGEATYVKTIATLEDTIKDKKDTILRVSSRISFERDMAVVDDSIKRMKAEVRKNPKNEAAKQILRNSYQNKIELLNSVAEKSELTASLD